jgi:hypothetical protein
MNFINDFIDLKITALYSFLVVIFSQETISFSYRAACGIVFLGYNIHRWYLMHKAYQDSKKDKK